MTVCVCCLELPCRRRHIRCTNSYVGRLRTRYARHYSRPSRSSGRRAPSRSAAAADWKCDNDPSSGQYASSIFRSTSSLDDRLLLGTGGGSQTVDGWPQSSPSTDRPTDARRQLVMFVHQSLQQVTAELLTHEWIGNRTISPPNNSSRTKITLEHNSWQPLPIAVNYSQLLLLL